MHVPEPAPMALLTSGIPLTLLLDLAIATPSSEILEHERGSADWLVREVS